MDSIPTTSHRRLYGHRRAIGQGLICLLIAIVTSQLTWAQVQLEETTIDVSTIITDLDVLWDLTLASDGMVWVTELDGTISRLDPTTNDLQLIHNVVGVEVFGYSAGMHSIVTHPDFENSPFVYVHYLYSETESRVERYTFDPIGLNFSDPLTILDNIPGGVSHNGSRMLIIDDKLHLSLGDGFASPAQAQDLDNLLGTTLRMELDGSVPPDNPIAGSLIWSWGHRNAQGMCVGNGMIYSSEHGTSHDDELNIIEPDRNYGWPEVEGYCDESSETAFCLAENVREPIWTWTPSIAPAGIDYYDHPAIPEWSNSILMAVLKDRQIIQMKLSPDGTSVLEENAFFTDEFGRLRDVLSLPDGRILVITSNRDVFGVPGPDDDRILVIEAVEGSTCTSDLNGNGQVDVGDFLIINSDFGSACPGCATDLDGSGVVDINDFILFNSDFGSDCN